MKNIIITLPKNLWDKIVLGEKRVELRKIIPLYFDNTYSRCYVVIKGTSNVVGYFAIGSFGAYNTQNLDIEKLSKMLCVPKSWVETYIQKTNQIVFWYIKHVFLFYPKIKLSNFGLEHNPQSYVYTDWSINGVLIW